MVINSTIISSAKLQECQSSIRDFSCVLQSLQVNTGNALRSIESRWEAFPIHGSVKQQ
jgi:hypothetical protein